MQVFSKALTFQKMSFLIFCGTSDANQSGTNVNVGEMWNMLK
jgi:hypothetical protein